MTFYETDFRYLWYRLKAHKESTQITAVFHTPVYMHLVTTSTVNYCISQETFFFYNAPHIRHSIH